MLPSGLVGLVQELRPERNQVVFEAVFKGCYRGLVALAAPGEPVCHPQVGGFRDPGVKIHVSPSHDNQFIHLSNAKTRSIVLLGNICDSEI